MLFLAGAAAAVALWRHKGGGAPRSGSGAPPTAASTGASIEGSAAARHPKGAGSQASKRAVNRPLRGANSGARGAPFIIAAAPPAASGVVWKAGAWGSPAASVPVFTFPALAPRATAPLLAPLQGAASSPLTTVFAFSPAPVPVSAPLPGPAGGGGLGLLQIPCWHQLLLQVQRAQGGPGRPFRAEEMGGRIIGIR